MQQRSAAYPASPCGIESVAISNWNVTALLWDRRRFCRPDHVRDYVVHRRGESSRFEGGRSCQGFPRICNRSGSWWQDWIDRGGDGNLLPGHAVFLAVVALMSFTYNVGIGITAGFVLYPFCKLVSGRVGEIKPGLWVLAGLSLLFFVFYPYP